MSILINLSVYRMINYLLKGTWGQNFAPVFMIYILSILWRKNLLPSFMVFWSVLTKLWSCKVWIWRKWCHNRECTKHFNPGFLFIFSVNFLENEISTKFYGVFDYFSGTYEATKSEWLNCVSTLVTSLMRMNITQYTNFWITCKLLGILVDSILFYDEKCSFSTKAATLASALL